ncbi:MAG: glycosyltransferase 87 family protein [Marmoricola sp.]
MRHVSPTLTDPVARGLSEVVGGPRGRHGLPHRWWTPVRVLMALVTGVFVLSIVHRVPCMQTDWSGDAARYAKMCYSDVPYLYTGRGLAEGLWPYSDSFGRYEVMEYPVGITYLAWFAAKLTLLIPSGPSLSVRAHTDAGGIWGLPGMAGISGEVNTYFLLTALLLFLFLLASTWLLAGTHRGRPWDALPFVLSPCLLLTGLINWDLMAVALVAGALWAWSRDRPLLTGVLIGLGAATKLYPLFLLGAVLVVAWRRRRLRQFALATIGAVLAWTLANLPAWVTGWDQWKVFWTFNSERGADLGSLWLVLSHAGVTLSPSGINAWSWVLFGATCLAIAVLGLVAPRTPRLAQLGFLIVAGFLLVNKVYSPQYVLWLLPLAVLARPRWRDLLIWQAGELFYFGAVWLYLGGWLEGSTGGTAPLYDVAIVVRVVAELYLVAIVVRDLLRPQSDLVEGDPDLGDLDTVEVGRGEADPDRDLVADLGH